MTSPKFLVIATAILLLLLSPAVASTHQFPATGSLQFALHDDINLPFYSWPRTLLSYSVDFSASHIRQNQLQLIDDATGKQTPFQLSDITESNGELKFATLNFFSDLKPGATNSFTLSSANQPASIDSQIKATAANDLIE